MTKNRIYGLDLLRVLSMFGIIGLHIMNAGGLMNAACSPSQRVIVHIFASICYCSVNTFAMLTGFLYIEKKRVRSSNLIDLVMVVAFYCISILAIFLCLKPELFANSRSLVIYSLFPLLKGRYWFITSYVLVFMMIPYLNAMIGSLPKQQFGKMLLILFVLLSLVPTFGLQDYFKTMDGYSPAWLIFCYLIGAYIKLYYDEHRSKRCSKSLIIFIVNVFVVTLFWLSAQNTVIGAYIQLYEYTSPFMVINAACLVFAYSQISIPNDKVKKVLLRLSNSAFGVYIIHSHILIYDFFLTDAFSNAGIKGFWVYSLILIISMLGIYLVCWILDEIRIFIFRVLCINRLSNWLGEKVDRFLNWC